MVELRGAVDDSGPNLLVRGVAFLLAVAVLWAALTVVRRVRSGPRHRSSNRAPRGRGERPVPVLVIDGSRFSDLAGFAAEFSRLLVDHTWRGNLDAFDDILRGGFGTPEGGFTLRWDHAQLSRERLGHAAMATRLEGQLETCHQSNRDRVAEQLDAARRGVGPTLFDVIVEIIEGHGPGGAEACDGIHLDLRGPGNGAGRRTRFAIRPFGGGR